MNDNMKELRKVYEQVRNHPYRRNEEEKYLKSYVDLLYKLGHVFYLTIKDTKYKSSANMIHDFNGSISSIRGKFYALHIERCIGVIHLYLDTNTVPYFYTYYTGINILVTLPRVCKHIFDIKDNKYYPDYSEEELRNSIKEIKNKWKEKPEYKDYSFSIYSQEEYDWLNDLLERKLYRGG